MRFEIIKSTIQKIPFVNKINKIEQREFSIIGTVEILFEDLSESIDFDFKIEKEYPLKSYNSESITFSNIDLLPYNHVMQSGNICIHTSHSTSIEEKLKIDFNSLKAWIIKYYLRKEQDNNYEHIAVEESEISNHKYSFIFTEVKKSFLKGEIGTVRLSLLNDGLHKESNIWNFYVQSFEALLTKKITKCEWSDYYINQKTHLEGIYYFLEESPAIHNRFAYSKWNELSFSSTFLNMLYEIEQDNLNNKGKVIPLFIGYKISTHQIHWQVALLEVGNFPLKGVPERVNDRKTGKWLSTFNNSEIKWGLSRNSSYEYFFGRGKFADALTKKKILIIGIGAVGSMVAKTLTQCGCTRIDFVDYDIKEPENVCRSEYRFANGITNKSTELEKILFEISPFVNSTRLNNNYFEKLIKSFFSDKDYQLIFKNELENYDLIIDCSTDNDLMYVLNSIQLETELVNISITNHAKELIFAFNPNIYSFVNNQFSNVLDNDVQNLYEPTGCWSPTFKGSYNDIAALVQLALKHFNRIENGEKVKNNFVIQEIDNSLKTIEY
ncbi:ThiF family adenylyltransferase [Kaistella sp.]|uniref:ThiF family adenylyltransferase n=1 Tax=Kaistella sp. TaxID=2782235 RepID=UPI002F9365BF